MGAAGGGEVPSMQCRRGAESEKVSVDWSSRWSASRAVEFMLEVIPFESARGKEWRMLRRFVSNSKNDVPATENQWKRVLVYYCTQGSLTHFHPHTPSFFLSLSPFPLFFSFLCIPELCLMEMHKKCFPSMKCNPSTHSSYTLCRNESISAGKEDKSI